MTKYVLMADSFPGSLSFIYDSKGYLVEFIANSWQIAEDVHAGILRSLGNCLTAHGFFEWVRQYRYIVKKEDIDLTWQRFYDMYGIKRDGYKAEPKWNKLSEKERYYTLINLKAYKRYCLRNPQYTQMYPATYLEAHRKDDWDRVPDFKNTSNAKGK